MLCQYIVTIIIDININCNISVETTIRNIFYSHITLMDAI